MNSYPRPQPATFNHRASFMIRVLASWPKIKTSARLRAIQAKIFWSRSRLLNALLISKTQSLRILLLLKFQILAGTINQNYMKFETFTTQLAPPKTPSEFKAHIVWAKENIWCSREMSVQFMVGMLSRSAVPTGIKEGTDLFLIQADLLRIKISKRVINRAIRDHRPEFWILASPTLNCNRWPQISSCWRKINIIQNKWILELWHKWAGASEGYRASRWCRRQSNLN